MSAKQKSVFGLACFVLVGGSFVAGSFFMSLDELSRPGAAMAATVEAPTAGAGKELQILSTSEFMKIMVDVQYEALKDAVENPPEKRTEWRQLYITSFPLTELYNLMYSRNDEPDFQSTPDWTAEVDKAMTTALTLAHSVRDRADYAVIKENFLAVVASCNDCHNRFEPGEIDRIEPPTSWTAAAAE